jgi:hypothetical protein
MIPRSDSSCSQRRPGTLSANAPDVRATDLPETAVNAQAAATGLRIMKVLVPDIEPLVGKR